jgi:methylphosphotriester-DNA--protein-cysteine methyltransferase
MKPSFEELQKASGRKAMFHRQAPLSTYKGEFDSLCHWIDAHLSQPIGWQELMSQSHLDHQTIHALFFKYESTTPMTWIRRRREAQTSTGNRLPTTLLARRSAPVAQTAA